MPNNKSSKNKHMTLQDRIEIQECLSKGMTFKAIGRRIGKDQTTVSKEVKLHAQEHRNGFVKTDQTCPEARLFDLSEKHLAWFSYTPLPDNNEAYPSQGGEGLHVILPEGASPNTISEKTYNIGGVCNYASTIFSAGMGPVLEKEAPYQKTKEEEYNLISLVTVEVKEDGKYNM